MSMNITAQMVRSDDVTQGHVLVGQEGGFSLVQDRGPDIVVEGEYGEDELAIVLLTEHGQLWLPSGIEVHVVQEQAMRDAVALIDMEEMMGEEGSAGEDPS